MLYLIIALIILGIVIFLTSPKMKGKMGEIMIIAHADKYLNDDYMLLHNCTFKDEQGRTTQVDHIILSVYGVFVIETKNYKGEIYAHQYQKQWTQKLGNHRYHFQNPLHQNYRHVKVLETILSDLIESTHIHSLVIFTPKSEFKTALPQNVFQGSTWVKYVQSFQQPVITAMRLKRIRSRLEKERLDQSWKTDREHIQQLQEKQ